MDKKVVRSSYENCLDATARLAAYATSQPIPKAPEVNARQDTLATNDLISFSIHARRLIDNIGLYTAANKIALKCCDGSNMSIWKFFGAIIHHNELVVIRCGTRLRMLKAWVECKSEDEYWNRVIPELVKGTYSEPVAPLVLFKSDKTLRTVVRLDEPLLTFSQKILKMIVREASDHKLYLDDDPFEDIDISKKGAEVLAQLQQKNLAS